MAEREVSAEIWHLGLEIKFAGIALNWRSAFSKASYSALKKEGFQDLGLSWT